MDGRAQPAATNAVRRHEFPGSLGDRPLRWMRAWLASRPETEGVLRHGAIDTFAVQKVPGSKRPIAVVTCEVRWKEVDERPFQ
jgi:hypothetical protein